MPDRVIQGVLFDLDGTLLDTAPDLAWALNTVLAEEGCPALPYERIRVQVSHGGKALTQLGFPDLDVAAREALRQRLLAHYIANISRLTRPFPGMEALLTMIEDHAIPWGIVTNKPSWLTNPLVADLGLDKRAASIVSGDSAPRNKPDPDTLFLAAEQMGVDPNKCIYIGDAQRDVEAGRRAGMLTAVALFGYLNAQDDPASWGPHAMIETTEELTRWTQARLRNL